LIEINKAYCRSPPIPFGEIGVVEGGGGQHLGEEYLQAAASSAILEKQNSFAADQDLNTKL